MRDRRGGVRAPLSTVSGQITGGWQVQLSVPEAPAVGHGQASYPSSSVGTAGQRWGGACEHAPPQDETQIWPMRQNRASCPAE